MKLVIEWVEAWLVYVGKIYKQKKVKITNNCNNFNLEKLIRKLSDNFVCLQKSPGVKAGFKEENLEFLLDILSKPYDFYKRLLENAI